MEYNKPLPVTKGVGEQFWAALKQKKLLIQGCEQCGQQIFYPRIMCPNCGSTAVTYKEHSGKGEVYSFSVIYKTRHPGFKQDVPYVLALVDLDGGGRLMTNIIHCEPEQVKIGSKVEIHFTDVTDQFTLPHFTLL